MKRYLRLPTAHEIWSALSKAFYYGNDELQVFALNQKAFTAKQNGKSLSEYYGELTEVFREMDHRDKVVMKDPDDIESISEVYRATKKGINAHYLVAHNPINRAKHVLRHDPVPDLEGCYSLVRQEVVRRATLKKESENSEASVMMTGHTKSRCFELVGYPEWWDYSRWKKNSMKTSATAVVKTEDDGAEKALVLVVTGDNGGKILNISTSVVNSAWIIDSGATDHMTFNSRQVSSLNSSSQHFVSTVNGTSTPIIGKGALKLPDNLHLDYVLVVPSLAYNLLSVSQLTTALSCVVIFWPDFCVFRDIQTKQTIGCGIRRGKLYYLDLISKSSDKLRQALTVDGSEGETKKSDGSEGEKKKYEIWLRHRRLGMTWLCLMKSKSEVNLLFQKFHKMVETHYNAYVQQNGVAKGKNRHLLEVVRASLIEAHMPLSYWGETLTAATYLINRVPSSSIDFQTPWLSLTQLLLQPSQIYLLMFFGCVAFVHLHKYQRNKLTPQALRCVFLGYAAHKKGHRYYHPPTRRMFITIDVVFHEDSIYFSSAFELQGE
ncbi:uncharacterized protein LOC132314630 [Cornus florida]|uniref:uncharacterized protein LOC132314630 n=1 Tax=Cornus florida TaxID=4283 RepID=UPI0028A2B3E3|nr:uncharacterized protein LOC132314630 [Cornus florida]